MSKLTELEEPQKQTDGIFIKIMELNAQDLFIDLEYDLSPSDADGLSEGQWQALSSGKFESLKPLHQLRGLARAIRDEDPDVVALTEVGGMPSLENFNRLFLDSEYIPLFDSSPSGRGIDCAYLVHRDFSMRAEIHGHRKVPVFFTLEYETDEAVREELARWLGGAPLPPTEGRRLSRDVPELRLYFEGDRKPAIILLTAHLKSKADHDRVDQEGRRRRAAELRAVLGLRMATQDKHPGVPVLLLGDMNGNATRRSTEAEFRTLYAETDLRDALAIAKIPLKDRYTHVSFPPDEEIRLAQLDYIFVPEWAEGDVLEEGTYVHRYRNEYGEEVETPRSTRERRSLPSDHYPVVLTIEVRRPAASGHPPPEGDQKRGRAEYAGRALAMVKKVTRWIKGIL